MTERLSYSTARLDADQRARAYSAGLTAMVKHPTSAYDRAAFYQQSVTKGAVGALATDDFSIYAPEFLSVPAGARLLNRLIGQQAAPAFVRVQSAASDPRGEWVGERLPIPLVKPAFDEVITETGKFGFIVPIARDLQASSDDRAISAVERITSRALIRSENGLLLSTDAAIQGVRPAGFLASAPEIGGGSPTSLETDLQAMFAYVSDGGAASPVLVASMRVALWMSLLRIDGGAMFPHVRVDGTGHVGGVPLLTAAAAANRLILVDAGELVVVDDGLEVSVSTQAAVQMDDSPSTGAAQMVSGWQANLSFLRFLRRVWWALLREDAVAFTTITELGGSPA